MTIMQHVKLICLELEQPQDWELFDKIVELFPKQNSELNEITMEDHEVVKKAVFRTLSRGEETNGLSTFQEKLVQATLPLLSGKLKASSYQAPKT